MQFSITQSEKKSSLLFWSQNSETQVTGTCDSQLSQKCLIWMEAGNSEPTSDRRAHWWHPCELRVCKQSPYCFNRHKENCHNNRWKNVLLHLGCSLSKAKLRLAVLTKTAFYSDFMVGVFILFVFIHMPLFSPPRCPVKSPPLSTQPGAHTVKPQH